MRWKVWKPREEHFAGESGKVTASVDANEDISALQYSVKTCPCVSFKNVSKPLEWIRRVNVGRKYALNRQYFMEIANMIIYRAGTPTT